MANAVSKRAREHLSQEEPMAALIERVGPIRVELRRQSPFQSLSRAIVYQQLSGKAAETIHKRFVALFSKSEYPNPGDVARTSLEHLRTAGLSRPKAGYILDLARYCEAGKLPELAECDMMEDEQIIEKLTQIKGIGRWTVEMFLIFNLGRPDVLPIHDLGVRRGFQITFGKRSMPKPEKLRQYGKRWAPYRTLAARYLWRATDLELP